MKRRADSWRGESLVWLVFVFFYSSAKQRQLSWTTKPKIERAQVFVFGFSSLLAQSNYQNVVTFISCTTVLSPMHIVPLLKCFNRKHCETFLYATIKAVESSNPSNSSCSPIFMSTMNGFILLRLLLRVVRPLSKSAIKAEP